MRIDRICKVFAGFNEEKIPGKRKCSSSTLENAQRIADAIWCPSHVKYWREGYGHLFFFHLDRVNIIVLRDNNVTNSDGF
jgi:hypothetical protein